MPCFKPISAYQNNSGVVTLHDRTGGDPLKLPCRKCIGCRIDHASDWALRCVHEASFYEHNVFITLTYNAENLPPDCGLRKRDFQLFIKRLRRNTGQKIRYYMCGEYGDNPVDGVIKRPHYHAILFNYKPPDLQYFKESRAGHAMYTSNYLEQTWGKGFVTIGDCNYETAQYCAQYVMKKINGKQAEQRDPKTGLKPYERFDSFTGEIVQVLPEYSAMSRRPGIGYNWFHKYTSDLYPKDYVTHNGIKRQPSPYYDKLLRLYNPDLHELVKEQRKLEAAKSVDNTPNRLQAREVVKYASQSTKKRELS